MLYFLGLFALIYFSATNPSGTLEEKICARVSAQYGDCKKILLNDTSSDLVFAESDSGIIPVIISKDHSEIKQIVRPLDFQEYSNLHFRLLYKN